jgi:hypothetical protein
VVAALNPLQAKTSLVLPIAHRLWATQHHALDSPTGPGVQKFSHEQDIDNRNHKKERKVRAFPTHSCRPPKGFEAVLEATCGVALQPPAQLAPETVDISRDKSEVRCRFGLLLCTPSRFSLFHPILACSSTAL